MSNYEKVDAYQRALELLIKKKELGITDEEIAKLVKPEQPQINEAELKAAFIPASPFDDLTPEEIMYYATPYFDELMAQKDAKAKQAIEEQKFKETLNGTEDPAVKHDPNGQQGQSDQSSTRQRRRRSRKL